MGCDGMRWGHDGNVGGDAMGGDGMMNMNSAFAASKIPHRQAVAFGTYIQNRRKTLKETSIV